MKNMRRLIALLLAVVMVLTCTACSSAGKWIARTEDGDEIPVGVWIWFVYNDLYEAYNKAPNANISPLDQTIEEKDGDVWVTDTAKMDLAHMITVKKLAKDLGLELDAAKLKEITDSVNSVWEASSQLYESVGISKQSLQVYYEFSALSSKVFDYYYGIGGKKGNTKESLIKYVEEKSLSVQYLSKTIKEDSDGQTLTASFNAMAEKFRNGMSVDDIVKEYNAEQEKDADKMKVESLTYAKVELTSNSNDLEKAMQNIKPGQATVVKYNNVLYVLFGRDIKEVSKEYVEESSAELLSALHEEEYFELLDGEAEKVSFELNKKACKKYSPKWLEKIGR